MSYKNNNQPIKKAKRFEKLIDGYPFKNQDFDFKSQQQEYLSKTQQQIQQQIENEQKILKQNLQRDNFGINYQDPYALDKMIDSFFYKTEQTQTIDSQNKNENHIQNYQKQEQQLKQQSEHIASVELQNNYEENDSIKYKKGKFEVSCPFHRQNKPQYFCTEPECKASYRIACKDCIVESPHKLHKNEKIQFIEQEVKKQRQLMDKRFNQYKNIVQKIQEPFEQIKELFTQSMNLILSHWLQEYEPELRKLYNIKEFLQLTGENFKICEKFKNKNLSKILFQLSSEEHKSDFLSNYRPDNEKIDLFQRFFKDRTEKLQSYSKQFIQQLLPTYLQEVNYNKLLDWEREEKKNYQKLVDQGFLDPKILEQQQKEKEKKEAKKREMSTTIQGKIQATFQDHKDQISSVLNFQDNYSISASQDGTIKILDLLQQKTYKTVDLQSQEIIKIEQLSDKYILASYQNSTMKIIDAINGLQVENIPLESPAQCMLKFDENNLIYAMKNGNIGIFDFTDLSAPHRTIKNAHKGKINCITKVGETRYATGGNDKMIYLWNLFDEKVGELHGNEDAVLNIVAMDDWNLISSSYDRKILHFNLKANIIEKQITYLNYSQILPEHLWPEKLEIMWSLKKLSRELIVMGGEDKNITIWNYKNQKVLKYLTGHYGIITSLNVSKDGSKIISGDNKSQVLIWT
ncbi:WD40-repeat-containing domain [Pseudocohnilembus persalinus]|uniref:WD40-repeat-containing domain n=1 Tax=Pseudocohnilembus persalinus TaxID=266149 RepID=A0A0V0QN43_PSEPJ|nr:WD40-repeat-containing domain [Pseudocohnilembus persalinus]|eukprot:KRX03365.1 WD40-repeat-containing domain [Pseudocohnilembus persalinus]